jgi:hypothetical protein
VFVFDERDEDVLAGGMKPQAFKDLYGNRRINRQLIAPAWLTSESRRTYAKIVFDPSGKPSPDCFNTYNGLAVKPVKGCVERMLVHIREVWCGSEG